MGDESVVRRIRADIGTPGIDAVHDLLTAWWSEVGDVAPRVRIGFHTAVAEIAGNIVEHSAASAEGTFTVELAADRSTLRATFVDRGAATSFDPAAVRMAAVDREDGRGLALAAAGVDRIGYRRDGDRNVWELESDRNVWELESDRT